jgi:polyribonucleotide nucleotidyltransferase
MVVETGERVDGRKANEVRPLMVKGNYLPRVHGSGLFQRGQTQVLSVCTLGMLNEWQRLDTIEPVDGKRYIHHYNFPPFCTGETGRMGAPKRREIGHGALAERALRPVIPSEEEFPYTIRVVSEVLESNGSKLHGLDLRLHAGAHGRRRAHQGARVRHCHGPHPGGGQAVILTDIQGLEDFLGDMDFKVTGTAKGITALQMDNKAKGLSAEILAPRSSRRKEGRMPSSSTPCSRKSPSPRAELRDTAPRIETIKIPVDKIRDVIGTGGKVIRGIQEETGATIDIQEDGTVIIAAVDWPGGRRPPRAPSSASSRSPRWARSTSAASWASRTSAPSSSCTPSKDGLLHISRMANGRVGKVEDVLNIGDRVKVQGHRSGRERQDQPRPHRQARGPRR